MNRLLQFGGAAAALATGLALAGLTVNAGGLGPAPSWGGHLVFAQTNAAGGNQVLAYRQDSSAGRLAYSGSYATGGTGASASEAVADSLASQSSLVYSSAHGVVIAVNAGSDSISVLAVVGNRLQLRQVLPSGGTFPDSLGVSGNLVYVLNAGGSGVVQGYRFEGGWLSPLSGSERSLGLTNSDPPNYLDPPGQVGFTPDGRQLVVTTKSSDSDIDVYRVLPSGYLLAAPAVNPAAEPVPFSFSFDQFGRLVVTEGGSSSVTTYDLSPGGLLSEVANIDDGETALCWITAGEGYFFGANAGSNDLSGFRVSADGSVSLLGPDDGVVAATGAGPIDLTATRNGYLYVEAGVAGAIDEFQVGLNGSLGPIGVVTGLPAGIEGIAAS